MRTCSDQSRKGSNFTGWPSKIKETGRSCALLGKIRFLRREGRLPSRPWPPNSWPVLYSALSLDSFIEYPTMPETGPSVYTLIYIHILLPRLTGKRIPLSSTWGEVLHRLWSLGRASWSWTEDVEEMGQMDSPLLQKLSPAFVFPSIRPSSPSTEAIFLTAFKETSSFSPSTFRCLKHHFGLLCICNSTK